MKFLKLVDFQNRRIGVKDLMRKKRLALNTISSLVFQITTIVCGFILPRLILQYFGSEVNGLVNSVTQFLQIISFLELGVGSVVQSSLYKPLVDKNNSQVSAIIVSAGRFFKRLAKILLIYVIVLLAIYPYIANQNFSHLYSATLIAAMSISSFAQYYFGVVDRLLLTADQHGYIQYTAQTITLVLNTFVCVILIKCGSTIQIVKLTTSLIYLLRPIYLRLYVNRHYNINRKIEYEGEPIKQKWNGVAQHIAAVILDGTDNVILTIFATLSDVSIYSVYHLVVYGVKQLFTSMTNGIQSLIGELWARQELKTLYDTFGWVEWLIHTGVTYIFCCTGFLIVPFIQIYTYGVNDANYIQPFFAYLITAANAMHCLRLPYNIMILAGGHYKQTMHNYIIVALINIVISISAVKLWGIIGVAIGTLVAMFYQTVWMALYNSRNLLKWPIKNFIKQIIVDVITVLIGRFVTLNIVLNTISYLSWIIMAVKTAVLMLFVVIFLNSLLYKEKIFRCLRIIKR